MADVSISREIQAPADKVWSMISDLPNMDAFSSENDGGTWLGGATAAAPGVKFRGFNSHGSKSWKTVATVVDAVPGKRFSFTVKAVGLNISEWVYELQATGDGCLVTESWTDRRPGFFKPISRIASGIADRQVHTKMAIEATLGAIAAAAEA
jgi:uncharacterized protein YndB with AHSA1/START domain